jgi:hypothetical protein
MFNPIFQCSNIPTFQQAADELSIEYYRAHLFGSGLSGLGI